MTPSRFSEQSDRRGRAGFTLLELLVVLVIVALVAGLIAPALGRDAVRQEERRQCTELTTLLAAQRVDAMRAGRPVAVSLFLGAGEMAATRASDPPRVWKGWRTELLDAQGRAASEAIVPFDAVGRTRARELSFRALDGSDRIWAVVFDPISGAPSLRLHTEERRP